MCHSTSHHSSPGRPCRTVPASHLLAWHVSGRVSPGGIFCRKWLPCGKWQPFCHFGAWHHTDRRRASWWGGAVKWLASVSPGRPVGTIQRLASGVTPSLPGSPARQGRFFSLSDILPFWLVLVLLICMLVLRRTDPLCSNLILVLWSCSCPYAVWATDSGFVAPTNIIWKPIFNKNFVKTIFLKFQKNLKIYGMLREWCFIATQNFKLKHITICELWKRQIQHWFCLFHSLHLVMCFNSEFCVAIKHHPLNIPYFFQIFLSFKTSFPRGFHWMLVSVWYSPQTLQVFYSQKKNYRYSPSRKIQPR